MSYFYMSNINNFTDVSTPNASYLNVGKYSTSSAETPSNGIIKFTDNNYINQKASFIMIRAHEDNSLLLQLYPYNYGVYIPAGELWAVDSIDKVEKIIVRNIFNTNGEPIEEGKIQWMIGYK